MRLSLNLMLFDQLLIQNMKNIENVTILASSGHWPPILFLVVEMIFLDLLVQNSTARIHVHHAVKSQFDAI